MNYDIVCPNSKTGDLARLEKLVATANELLPDWVEIRMDRCGKCYAYRIPTAWIVHMGLSFRFLGKGKKRWGWKTFWITRHVTEEVTAENATTE
jgi:hypothetical protein